MSKTGNPVETIIQATVVDNVRNEELHQSATPSVISTELPTNEPTGTQPLATEPPSTDVPHTDTIPASETPANPTETQASIVKQSDDGKGEVWEGTDGAECPLPTGNNVTLTSLTEFAPQDPSATQVNLDNCVYGLAPVMTSPANQQLRPIANQFGANTTTLFAAGNYPHIITTPSQAGLQGFATAGM